MISDQISDDISPQMKNFDNGFPHSNTFLQFCLKFMRRKRHKAARHPTISDIINDVKLFPSVYRGRYSIRCTVTKSSALEYGILLCII